MRHENCIEKYIFLILLFELVEDVVNYDYETVFNINTKGSN